MRCEKCGRDFRAGLNRCPHCGVAVHYGGKTEFYGKAIQSKLTIADFFCDIFKSHPAGTGDKMFIAGTPLTTPTPDRMLIEWEKPWLYARVLLAGLLFSLLSYFMYAEFRHPGGAFLLFSLGALFMPLGILVFYWESNIPRDIPIYKVILIFFIGGLLSILFTIAIHRMGVDSSAVLAPITEEPGKIIALSIFIYLMDIKYIFGGLLVGAAVGAGFAAFEDIYYIMDRFIDVTLAVALDVVKSPETAGFRAGSPALLQALLQSASVYFDNPSADAAKLFIYFKGVIFNVSQELGCGTLTSRTFHAIGGHAAWAAIEGGALVWAKGNEKLAGKHFLAPNFLVFAVATMTMHYIWNNDAIMAGHDEFRVWLMCAIAIGVSCILVKKAILQVMDAADRAQFEFAIGSPQAASNVAAQAMPMLNSVSGPLAGCSFPLDRHITIGRDPEICNVIFPPDTPGISRKHCEIERRADGIWIKDTSSTGVYLPSGERLPPGQWVRTDGNFCLGSSDVTFSVDA